MISPKVTSMRKTRTATLEVIQTCLRMYQKTQNKKYLEYAKSSGEYATELRKEIDRCAMLPATEFEKALQQIIIFYEQYQSTST